MTRPEYKNERIPCENCSKHISRNNMSVHKKTCGLNKKYTYDQLVIQLKNCNDQLKENHTKLNEKDTQLHIKDYRIQDLENQVKILNTQLVCNSQPVT